MMPEIENAEIGKLISEFLKHEKPESRAVFIRKYWFFDSVSDIAARYSFTESKVPCGRLSLTEYKSVFHSSAARLSDSKIFGV